MKKFILLSFLALFLFAASADLKAYNDDDFLTMKDGVTLSQNYPNPAINSTTIHVNFTAAEAELRVYNVLGKLIEARPIVEKTIVLDVRSYEPGVYLYTLEADGEKLTRRMTVK